MTILNTFGLLLNTLGAFFLAVEYTKLIDYIRTLFLGFIFFCIKLFFKNTSFRIKVIKLLIEKRIFKPVILNDLEDPGFNEILKLLNDEEAKSKLIKALQDRIGKEILDKKIRHRFGKTGIVFIFFGFLFQLIALFSTK